MNHKARKFNINATSVVFTDDHVRSLGGCAAGADRFRQVFPNGIKLDETTFNKYYKNSFKPIGNSEYSPNWVFGRIRMDEVTRPPTLWDIRSNSNKSEVREARKAVNAIVKEEQKAIYDAIAKVRAKYKPKKAKAEANLSAVCKKIQADIKATLKKSSVTPFRRFLRAFNKRSRDYYMY